MLSLTSQARLIPAITPHFRTTPQSSRHTSLCLIMNGANPTAPTPSLSGGLGRLSNKVAIVTGSSSGLGRAITLAYAREGAHVVCADLQSTAKVDIKDEAHKATHEVVQQNGGKSIFVKCDVGDSENVKNLVETAVKEFGRLDM